MEENNLEEQSTTSVRMSVGAMEHAKRTAKKIGMSQSSFFRFSIMTMCSRIERGEI